jgi:threonyl-tRNA synthetase
VIAVVGRREAEQRQVALRRLGSDQQQSMSLEQAGLTLASEASPPDLSGVVSGESSTRAMVAEEAG